MRIATTQFSLAPVSSDEDFWARFQKLVDRAAFHDVEALVFPEYFTLSLLMHQKRGSSFLEALRDCQEHSAQVLERAKKISKDSKISFVLGTVPWLENGRLTNRSHFVEPSGRWVHQDKIFMTRFENEHWQVQSGPPNVRIFQFQSRTCAILTCYDSEFAVASQALAEAGVELLFVPSNTDSAHGYWRVRHCCEARAVENQLFVALSSVVKGNPEFDAIDSHYGQGVLLGPCDVGFPVNGILAEGNQGEEGITLADLDFEKLSEIRRNGTVLNSQDSKAHGALTVARV